MPTDVHQLNLGEFLAMQATEALRRSSHLELRKIACRVRDRSLTLVGSVPTYYHKQLAQVVLLHEVAGKMPIQNDLLVSDQAATTREMPAH